MHWLFVLAIAALMVLVVGKLVKRRQLAISAELIDTARIPDKVYDQVRSRYPHLTDTQVEKVIDGLRDYFHLCLRAGPNRMVSMPSQVVDVAWHELILFTRLYERFCSRVFGRFLHHTPAEAMQSPKQAQSGIKTAWRLACQHESINPKTPHRIPLLFAIDRDLEIPDGFKYSRDCTLPNSQPYCASHIGCGSGCGSGCGGNDGGGCGGD